MSASVFGSILSGRVLISPLVCPLTVVGVNPLMRFIDRAFSITASM